MGTGQEQLDGVEALDRSYGRLVEVVAALGPNDLALPTVCSDWTVREVLNHTLGAGRMFSLANKGATDASSRQGDLIGVDPVLAVRRMRQENLASWRGETALSGQRTYPFGTVPALVGLLVNLGEVAVHAGDVAKATGHTSRMDERTAELLVEFYRRPTVERKARRPGAFGPALAIDVNASAEERLLAHLGRLV